MKLFECCFCSLCISDEFQRDVLQSSCVMIGLFRIVKVSCKINRFNLLRNFFGRPALDGKFIIILFLYIIIIIILLLYMS